MVALEKIEDSIYPAPNINIAYFSLKAASRLCFNSFFGLKPTIWEIGSAFLKSNRVIQIIINFDFIKVINIHFQKYCGLKQIFKDFI